VALEKNLYVAVFGYKFGDREDTVKKMLFVHWLGGDKALSFCTRAFRGLTRAVVAHGRRWYQVTVEEWKPFVEIVGERKCFHG
jgi:hypothetical protein